MVIDGDMSYCAEFLVKLATAPQDIESRMIVQKIIADNAGLLSSTDTVVLLDCDRKVNYDLINDTRAGNRNCITIGITSGIADIWERIREKVQFL